MYTSGDLAATPELARVAVGRLVRHPVYRPARRLAIESVEEICRDREGYPVYRRVVVEVEAAADQWTIG